MAQTSRAKELRDERMSRQNRLLNDAIEHLSVIIVGVGSIGSNAAHLLVSMGIHNITLIDHDGVSEENIFPSWFYPKHVGLPKVTAVYRQLEEYGVLASAYEQDISDFSVKKYYDVCIVATDSIESRMIAFEKLRYNCVWWLDARMGGDSCELFSFNTADDLALRTYQQLELRPVTEQLLCGEKATAYNTKGSLIQFIGWSLRDITDGKVPTYQLSAAGTNKMVIFSANPPVMV